MGAGGSISRIFTVSRLVFKYPAVQLIAPTDSLHWGQIQQSPQSIHSFFQFKYTLHSSSFLVLSSSATPVKHFSSDPNANGVEKTKRIGKRGGVDPAWRC
ncbi:hypothetical protein MRB53_033881 [Persea americana]|uniref:Uncharacterized protein n=1 Tax=Persea americana TaxID=3435 RepID=A0ACC2KW27_PERAE|nr:hypothetical protein MRB53_033881 [Persea americana]